MSYDVVRHYYPRSSADAQVTWQVTGVGFGKLWPLSSRPWIQNSLDEELRLSREAVEILVNDKRVQNMIKWGIDTLITFVRAQNKFKIFDTYLPQGKFHALYGNIEDLRTMVCECFAAVQSLKNEAILDSMHYKNRIKRASEVPEASKNHSVVILRVLSRPWKRIGRNNCK